jgi:hypothetical protein
MASFRMVLFPDPATPKIVFDSPRGRQKEMPFKTFLSSNAMATSSKVTAARVVQSVEVGDPSLRVGGAFIF